MEKEKQREPSEPHSKTSNMVAPDHSFPLLVWPYTLLSVAPCVHLAGTMTPLDTSCISELDRLSGCSLQLNVPC